MKNEKEEMDKKIKEFDYKLLDILTNIFVSAITTLIILLLVLK